MEDVCGPGADPTFDQLISALGHIARQKPKPLIDTIMFWRKAKGDAATVAKQMATQVRFPFTENSGSPAQIVLTVHASPDQALRKWRSD